MALVLLVDDDDYVREGLAAVLVAEGHNVLEAASIERARECVSKAGEKIELVLLDLWLPDGNGQEFLTHLQAVAADLPVVVMSGGGPGRSLEQALAFADATGASASIIKPFQNDELIEAVSRVLKPA